MELQGYLQKLHQSLGGPLEQNPNLLPIISDLKAFCFHQIPQDALGYSSEDLIFSDFGLLSFLRRTVNRKDINKEREEIVVFMKEFLDLLRRTQWDFTEAESLIVSCLDLFRKDQLSIRAIYLEVVMALLKTHHATVSATALCPPLPAAAASEEGEVGVRRLVGVLHREYVGLRSPTQTLRSNLLQLMGKLTEYFPEETRQKASILLPLFQTTLDTQLKSPKPDLLLYAGALNGYCYFLMSFRHLIAADEVARAQLFKYILSGITGVKDMSRYEIPRAALRIMASHSSILSGFYIRHETLVFEKLQMICHHTNKSLKHGAFDALDAFFLEVAAELSRQTRDPQDDRKTFSFFLMNFWDMLNKRGNITDITIAIRGFGKFSGPCMLYMEKGELEKTLDSLFEFGTQLVSGTDVNEDDTYLHLPNFVNTYALILHQLPLATLPSRYLSSLEHYLELIFVVYPNLFPKQKTIYQHVFSNLLKVLYLKGNAMHMILKKIVPFGLTLACSKRRLNTDKDEAQESGSASSPLQDMRPYFHYLSLWRHLLQPFASPLYPNRFEQMEFPRASEYRFRAMIFNELMESIIGMIQKLDLNYSLKSPIVEISSAKEEIPVDPLLAATATRQRDVEIFHHMVSFFELLLLETEEARSDEPHLFLGWVYIFSKEIVLWSTKLPLQSGFYTLLMIVFKLCEKWNFFEFSETTPSSEMSQVENLHGNVEQLLMSLNENRRESFFMISNFIKDVVERLKLYKHQLLYSCIKMVLAIPKPFVRQHLPLLIRPLELAFQLGLGHKGIADIAVDAIDYFVKCVTIDRLKPYFASLLPLLNNFLLVPETEESFEESVNKVESLTYRVTGRRQTSRKSTMIGTSFKPRQLSVQKKILLFLGSLGGNNLFILNEPEGTTRDDLVWDVTKRLRVGVTWDIAVDDLEKYFDVSKFEKSKSRMHTAHEVVVTLDGLLPRIVRLSESGNQNREITVTSCESLYAIVQFMIGRSATRKTSDSYHLLLRRVFPSLLRIATSSDSVPSQLFSPLIFQLIRWFTKNTDINNLETSALLDAILGALRDAADGLLRDFAAKCLSEFLKWSLVNLRGKSGGESRVDSGQTNAKQMFRKLFSLATHPSPYHRLGYSLAVRNIVKLFETDRSIFCDVIHNLLDKSIECLHMANGDDVAMGTLESMAEALLSLVELTVQLRTETKDKIDCDKLVELIWKGVGRADRRSRGVCVKMMEMMSAFDRKFRRLPEERREREGYSFMWIQSEVKKKGVKGVVGGLFSRYADLERYPRDDHKMEIERVSENMADEFGERAGVYEDSTRVFQKEKRRQYLEELCGYVEVHTWLLEKKAVSLADLSLDGPSLDPASPAPPLRHVITFISKYVQIAREFGVFDDLRLVHLTLAALAASYAFCVLLLDSLPTLAPLRPLLNSHFFHVVCFSILDPGDLFGDLYTSADISAIATLSDSKAPSSSSSFETDISHLTLGLMGKLHVRLRKSDDKDAYQLWKNTLNKFVKLAEKKLMTLNLEQSEMKVNKVLYIVRGYRQLIASTLISWGSKQDTAEALIRKVFQSTPLLPPAHVQMAESILDLAFNSNPSPQIIVDFLCDSRPIDSAEALSHTMTDLSETKEGTVRGLLFYMTFAERINAHIIEKPATFAELMMKDIAKNESPRASATASLVLVIDRLVQSVASGTVAKVPPLLVQEFVKHFHFFRGLEKVREGDILALLKSCMLPGNQAFIAIRKETKYAWSPHGGPAMKPFESVFLLTKDGHKTLCELFLPYLGRGVLLTAKVKLFDFLPFVVASPDAETRKRFEETIKNILVFDFPLRSTLLGVGTADYNAYTQAVERLFDLLEMTGDRHFLLSLLPLLGERNHIRNDYFSNCLNRFIETSAEAEAKETFRACVSQYFDLTNKIDVRTSVVERICIPIISVVTMDAAVVLFCECIERVMTIFTQPDAEEASAASRKRKREDEGRRGDPKEDLAMKTAAMKLLQALYEKVPTNLVLNTVYAFGNVSGKERNQSVLKTCHEIKSQLPPLFDDSAAEAAHLEYRCQAFNTLIAGLMNTKASEPNAEQFFLAFCFKESPEKKAYLWENIVYASKAHYNFAVSVPGGLTSLQNFHQYFSQYRNSFDAVKKGTQTMPGSVFQPFRGTQIADDNDIHLGIQYISSQYLADSSLADQLKGVENYFGIRKMDLISDANDASDNVIEMDELNLHPCMPSLLKLLDGMKMFQNANSHSMPKWMAEFLIRLEKSKYHINSRLLIAKLVVNRHNIFEPFADKFFRALAQLMCDYTQNPRIFHYFLRDICILFLRWEATKNVSQEDEPLLSRFLNLILQTIVYPDLEVLRANLTIFKLLCERWRKVFKPDLPIMTALIGHEGDQQNMNRMNRLAGLQVCGILLANEIQIQMDDIHMSVFHDRLLSNITFNSKDVYSASAEVCGILMNKESQESQFIRRLQAKVADFFSSQDFGRSLIILDKISRHHTSFVDTFFVRIFGILPSLVGEFKTISLKLITLRARQIPDVMVKLRPTLPADLEHHEEDIQLVSLRLLRSLATLNEEVSEVSPHVFHFMASAMRTFPAHPNGECRRIFYEICMYLYDRTSRMIKKSDSEMDFCKRLRFHLVEALKDADDDIRVFVVKFWDHSSHLSLCALTRFSQIISDLYSPESETNWLQVANELLIRLLQRDPSYSKKLFDLEGSYTYKEYPIDPSMRRFNLMDVPLFTHSASSSLPSESDASLSAPSDSSDGKSMSMELAQDSSSFSAGPLTPIDSSASLGSAAFSSSLAPKRKESSLFREIVSVRASATQSPSSSSSSSSSSSTSRREDASDAFAIPLARPRKAVKSYGGSLPLSQLIGWEGQEPSLSSEDILIRRRFDTTPSSMGTTLSHRQLSIIHTKQKMLQQRKFAQKNARFRELSLCRTYRTGEMPDFDLSLKDLLTPLLKLSSLDPIIARLLFLSLASPLWTCLIDNYSAVAGSFAEFLRSRIASIFEQSIHFSSPLISALFSLSISQFRPLRLAPKTVADASLRSSSLHSGILVIERLMMEQVQHRNADYRDLSAQLARLYKAIGDTDILASLYQDGVCVVPETRKALNYEVQGNYTLSYETYENLLSRHAAGTLGEAEVIPPNEEIAIWEDGRLHCIANLFRWKDLVENVLVNFGSPNSLWEELNVGEGSLIPAFVRGSLKHLEGWDKLYDFVDSATTQSQQSYLESHFLEEMALIDITRGKDDAAKMTVRKGFSRFLRSWSNIHPLAREGRIEELQRLQWLTEMNEFLFFETETDKKEEQVRSVTSSWLSRYPCPKTHTLLHWHDIIWSRHILLQEMFREVKKKATPRDLKGVKRYLLEARGEMYRHLANTAIKQGNYEVADIVIQSEGKAKKLPFSYIYTHVRHIWKSAMAKFGDHTDAAESGFVTSKELLRALTFLETQRKEQREMLDDRENSLQFSLLKGNLLAHLSSVCASVKESEMNELQNAFASQNLISKSSSPLSLPPIVSAVQSKAFQTYKEAIEKSLPFEGKGIRESASSSSNSLLLSSSSPLSQTNSTQEMPHLLGKIYMKFALFCETLLFANDNEDLTKWSDAHENYAKNMIEYLLKAMERESSAARERFPKVLPILEKCAVSRKTFMEKSPSVPCWMFISWISQMLAVLPQEGAKGVLLPVLVRIARTYPQAIYYPFTVSCSSIQKSNPAAFASLSVHLRLDAVDKFMKELCFLTHPEHRFKDLLESIRSQATAAEALTREVVDCFIAEMDESLWDTNRERGEYNTSFAKKWKQKVAEAIGNKGVELMSGSKRLTAAVNKLITLSSDMTKALQPSKGGKMELKKFSEWLAKDPEDVSVIEIPGQYKGTSKPQPELHIRMKNFDSTILIMRSIRKPKRIIIRGNNEREYPFLVKGGEDLRQDQRIQQLFAVMNHIFTQDAACCRRELSIRTYEVIPMTDKVGVIEWLSDTRPIREIIEEQMCLDDPSLSIQTMAAAKRHTDWINSFDGKTMNEKYLSMFSKGTRRSTEEFFNSLLAVTPADLLKKGITSLSSSSESYLSLRSHFCRSLACLSVASYIVGIGDRHLENFLIDLNSGKVIGIDFGHAFGTATQLLPIPELVPFRMTQQFIEFLAPLPLDGLLGYNMTHSLNALRKKKDLILTIMDTFVKEPLVDWVKNARKLHAAQTDTKIGRKKGEEEEGKTKFEDISWYPREKIRICKMKLDGVNPSIILCEEIRKSLHGKHPCCRALEKIIKGDEKDHKRANPQEAMHCNSVQSQVEFLMELSRDPNVLGRAYAGWTPWL